ncbi:MAG: hypothetical protein SP1CHLAM54_10050 [Chlamydiia bacterium]|nr:hypothetical protein [Chlamydiia bacterium]MCH9615911.1 hypothetical protein [Chlamydiia bacterium]MCH9628686.1 hypothetical protein [Chlamydiia bacterium]
MKKKLITLGLVLALGVGVFAWNLHTKKPKILVMIIDSDTPAVYPKLRNVWRQYMHLFPDNVEAYFLKADPNLEVPTKIVDDVIWCKTEEGLKPGIIMKTLMAMEHMLPRIDEFDYLYRTNLSSFIDFPKMLEFAKTLPKEKCYCAKGIKPKAPFGSGAGLFFSPDLVRMFVAEHAEVLDNIGAELDDVMFGEFFQAKKIKLLPAERVDYLSIEEWNAVTTLPEDIYHFRTKNNDPARREIDEVYIQHCLLEKVYGITALTPHLWESASKTAQLSNQ